MRDTIELNGLKFAVEIKTDETMREPWKEHDGHGIISEWTTRARRAGENVLARDGDSYRYYDIAETVKLALKDGWDAEPYRTGTKRERAARAVEHDYKQMKAWCDGKWRWCYVLVTLLDINGEKTKERESLGGIDGDDQTEYLAETAKELAEEIAARVGDRREICIPVRL